MQFHDQGYISADPRIQPLAGVGLKCSEEIPDKVDVLIIGTGPAGIITAAQLSQFPSITTRIIERRPGRLELGHADGVNARSVESFAAFGFADEIIAEAYTNCQTSFWRPDPKDPSKIFRASRDADDPAGVSEFPHILVNQARVADYFIDYMAKSPTRAKPDYGWEFVGLTIDDEDEYPVSVTIRRSAYPQEGLERVVKAKYVLGADGARSGVRASIGRKLEGTTSMHAWGVVDALITTDFPDYRNKSSIQSNTAGNLLWIPREGGFLTRLYVDLGEVTDENAADIRKTTLDHMEAICNQVLAPYSLKFKEVPWFSLYEVGHRVTDKFDNVPNDETGKRTPRVFIAGDACHTHSAKAGQGMNVSMQDGWNLGWKLGYVLDGRSPESILDTYSKERQAIAVDLVTFDRTWSTIMAKKPEELTDPAERETFYVGTWEFPAGMKTQYPAAEMVGKSTHQALAKGFPIGKHFKSGRAIRIADALPVHIGHLHEADGRWRIYVFADKAVADDTKSPTSKLAKWLETSPDSPLAFQPKDGDQNAWFDVKVIYRQPWEDIEMAMVPSAFKPIMGPMELQNWEQAFAVDPSADIFAEKEISDDGAIVVVRPDQYVAHVLPLTALDELAAFFKPLLLKK